MASQKEAREPEQDVGVSEQQNLATGPQDILLEQYKIYVEMADRVSSRRVEANKFYISILTALFALISLTTVPNQLQNYLVGIVAIFGIALCFIWIVNIRSYRELNSLKFKVIHELEQFLPFPCYDREWEILKNESGTRSYFRLTRIEQFTPYLLMGVYAILLIYALLS
jgi:hypothetical protein